MINVRCVISIRNAIQNFPFRFTISRMRKLYINPSNSIISKRYLTISKSQGKRKNSREERNWRKLKYLKIPVAHLKKSLSIASLYVSREKLNLQIDRNRRFRIGRRKAGDVEEGKGGVTNNEAGMGYHGESSRHVDQVANLVAGARFLVRENTR